MTEKAKHPQGLSTLSNRGSSWSFTVPAAMVRVLLEADLERALFRPELTNEGILYRLVDRDIGANLTNLPAWVQKEN